MENDSVGRHCVLQVEPERCFEEAQKALSVVQKRNEDGGAEGTQRVPSGLEERRELRIMWKGWRRIWRGLVRGLCV